MNKLGQEPAFPNDNTIDCQPPYCYGMSKRFYAACSAMNGILSGRQNYSLDDSEDWIRFQIKTAYALADELLKQEQEGLNEQG